MLADKPLIEALKQASTPNRNYEKGTYLLYTYRNLFGIFLVKRCVPSQHGPYAIVRIVLTNAAYGAGSTSLLTSEPRKYRRISKAIVASLTL